MVGATPPVGARSLDTLRAIAATAPRAALELICPTIGDSTRHLRERELPPAAWGEWQDWKRDCAQWKARTPAWKTPAETSSATRCTVRNENNVVRHPYDIDLVVTCTTD